jgi:adenosine kinase
MGCDRAALSVQVRGMVVTLGDKGCEIWQEGDCQSIDPITPAEVVDPTGCGDAWRGALLHGLQQGWDLLRCARLGNYMGAVKVAHRGPQNYRINADEVQTF